MTVLDVLVVDDDRDLAQSLAEVLVDAGHTVTLAYCGEDALELFRSRFFDLVLMDLSMPGMSGIESLEAIKKDKPAARILLMTGFSVEQVLEKALDEGAMGILHKPIQPDKLLKIVEDVNPEAAVLLVDDDADFSAAIAATLQDKGFRVMQAPDGETALAIADQHVIESMILDLRLPVLSGLETYLELKKMGNPPPTVIVSAYLDEECRNLDVIQQEDRTLCLRKPFDVDKLIGALTALARQDRAPIS